jgi:hypothetical protein
MYCSLFPCRENSFVRVLSWTGELRKEQAEDVSLQKLLDLQQRPRYRLGACSHTYTDDPGPGERAADPVGLSRLLSRLGVDDDCPVRLSAAKTLGVEPPGVTSSTKRRVLMNEELHALFVADQADRNDHPVYDTLEYWQLRQRDAQRHQRVNELLAEGLVIVPDDYFHTALIFQHGETLEDIWQAHELARRAAEMEATKAMDYKDSLWLAAAALDRWLMYQGKPQKYGTQFVPDGKRWRLWDVDPTTTDTERAANHVPALQEQLQQAERYTQELGQPPIEKAPEWMKEAIRRWEREDS